MSFANSYAVPLECERGAGAISFAGFVGAYFGLRVCLTFLFFQSAPQTGTAVGLAINLLLLVPAMLYSVGPQAMSLREVWHVRPFRFVVAFLTLALASLLWSGTPSLSIALGYWSALATDVLLVLLLVRTDGPKIACDSILKGFVIGVFVLSVIAWIAPPMKDLRLGDDDFLTPNAIGFECALGAILCQYLAPKGARWKWLGIALAITLLRSLSKTTILAFVVAEGFYLLRNRSITRATKLAIVMIALVVGLAFSGLFLSYYRVYSNAGNQAETLTGRTSIWLVTFGMALDKPWFGHGFHSYRSEIPIFGGFEPWHAHNELLQQFFVYGLVGVILVISLYVSLFRYIRKHRELPLALTGYSLLLLVVIRGFADTERFDLSFPLWTITAISLALSTPALATTRKDSA